ncbi:sesquiterpene synthase Cad-like [Cryptomeria japonica]|uniref:sesquiterpene synthase Cad-like n=1 Tax=Cryptomeria japonica TaxID=3369 RepID=UPI0027DAA62E|nr:sesquiterpene synthase Cad-like [Cryptomeria japonica]
MAEAAVLVDNCYVIGEDETEENAVVRRIGKYHANIWERDFLQFLSSPYGAPSYMERMETLVEEIKMDLFNSLVGEGEISPSSYDLLERFSIVDVVQRLGIDRHFEKEIKAVLDYTYKYWNENGISWGTETGIVDLHTTALGFRILRLNGYRVSSDVFHNFKDQKGQFICPTKQSDSQIRIMLSLYQASEISFPGENIMREAKEFARRCLKEALEKKQELKDKTQLLAEVEYILHYPWRCRVPRWEAWNSIQIFRQDIDSWMLTEGIYKVPNEWSKKILELAILDFNILQSHHQNELKYLAEWWDEAIVKQLSFFRHRHVEYYFWYTCGLYEPEYGATRLCYAKLGTLITIVDDIFDTYGTIDELIPFREVLINWDMSMMDKLPNYMQISLRFAHQTYMEITVEAEKIHGPRVQEWMKDYWKTLIWAEFQDAEWIAKKYHPTLSEYLKNSLISSTVPVVTLFPMILINTYLPDDILKRVNKFESRVAWGCRLIDDSKDFKNEQEHGETASWIECYARDNPGTTREQALDHVNMIIELSIEELTKERLFYDHDIPSCCKRLYFDSMYRSVAFIWRDIDGFSISHQGTKDDIMKILIESIPL